MSSNDLQKLKEEHAKLAKEHENLKKAVNLNDACDKVSNYIRQSEDPFNQPATNDWVSQDKGGGCCVIA